MLFFGWYNEIKSTQVLNLDSLKPKKNKRAFHVGFKIGIDYSKNWKNRKIQDFWDQIKV